ncbi:hypothetical protein QEN19_003898 [Hanseniaspora menglaensis]
MFVPTRRKRKLKHIENTEGDLEEDTTIKGPTSALTTFLKAEGIDANAIREKYDRYKPKEEQEKQEDEDDRTNINNAITDDISSFNSNTLVTESSEVAEKRVIVGDEENSDEEEFAGDDENQEDNKVSLQKTESLKKRIVDKDMARRRFKRLKIASDTLDLKNNNNISSLQEIIISNLNEFDFGNRENILSVLGMFSATNLQRISDALCKNRSLNSQNLAIFFDNEDSSSSLSELKFGDCSDLISSDYINLFTHIKQLRQIELHRCGQLNSSTLEFIGENFGSKIEKLWVDGAFLITDVTWMNFFKNVKGNLKSFRLGNTHRFTNECLQTLFSECSNLEELWVDKLHTITDYKIIGKSTPNLKKITVNNPVDEKVFDDDTLTSIFSHIDCTKLEILNLDGCTGVTNKSILYLNKFKLNSLIELSISDLDQIDNDSLTQLFDINDFNSLKKLCLRGSLELEDEILPYIFNLPNLDWLDLSCCLSLRFDNVSKLKKNLAIKRLNLSFVYIIEDNLLIEIINKLPNLEVVEVFGCNKVSIDKSAIKDALNKQNIIIVG